MSILQKPAPDFTLPNAAGEQVTLSDLFVKGPVVVFFYPKNDTPGCTKEACQFRDAFSVFSEAGCQVVGISADSAESHQKFASKYQLPFILLTDAGSVTAKAWGVKKLLGLLPGRETFLVDRHGLVVSQVSGHLGVERHVTETLAALRAL